MKIQIVIPLYRRHDVTRVCFDYLQSLITLVPQHEFSVLCVSDEIEYYELCRSYGFEHIAYKNDPLGEKINFAIKWALERNEWDYLMTMNSDSVINPKLFFDYYDELFGVGEFFGVSRVTYVNFYTDEAVDFEYHFSILGVARCMSRDLVKRFDEIGGMYESSRNKGLDDSVLFNSRKLNVKPTFVQYEGQLVYDLKSDVNIHPWEKFADKGLKVTNELCCKVG
jgi:hypothetical protein